MSERSVVLVDMDGVIADFEIAEGMLKALIKRVTPSRSLFRPKILIAVPSGITGVDHAKDPGLGLAGPHRPLADGRWLRTGLADRG